MINFWLIATLLIILASLFLLVPAFRLLSKESSVSNEADKSSREKENVNLFKERLSELDLELSEARISAQLYQERKQELELALLNDVDQLETPYTQVSSKTLSYGILGFSLIFVVVSSIWVYQSNGSKELVEEYYAMNFDAAELDKAKSLAKQGDMSALLKQLHEKLKSAPNNLEGWQLLARSAMNAQRYSLAIEAYEQIAKIYRDQDANSAPIMGLLAQAKYYQAEGKLTVDVRNAIESALNLDENELNSIGLLAIDAFSNQRYEEAKRHWEKILTIYPEHPAKPSIEAGIQRANAQLGISDNSASLSDPNAPSDAWINVRVSIADSISTLLDPNDTVFIIAKNVDQSSDIKAPLAVSRYTVQDLPVTIKLDDSKSMAPIAKMSMSSKVMVIARVSKSGNTAAQVGDYEAVSIDIDPYNQESIELMIQDKLN